MTAWGVLTKQVCLLSRWKALQFLPCIECTYVEISINEQGEMLIQMQGAHTRIIKFVKQQPTLLNGCLISLSTSSVPSNWFSLDIQVAMLLDISTTACIVHQQLPNVFQLKMPWPAGWLMHVCNPVLRRLRQEDHHEFRR